MPYRGKEQPARLEKGRPAQKRREAYSQDPYSPLREGSRIPYYSTLTAAAHRLAGSGTGFDIDALHLECLERGLKMARVFKGVRMIVAQNEWVEDQNLDGVYHIADAEPDSYETGPPDIVAIREHLHQRAS